MTSTDVFVERSRRWGRTLEDREAARHGVSIRQARDIVARRAGISSGTLETLRSGRLKAVAAHVYQRLWQAVIRDLHEELRRHEHELHLLAQQGLGPADREVEQVMAGISKIEKALEGER